MLDTPGAVAYIWSNSTQNDAFIHPHRRQAGPMNDSAEHTETIRRLIGGKKELENALVEKASALLDGRDEEPSDLAPEFAGEVEELIRSGEMMDARALAATQLLEAFADDVDWETLAEELLVRAQA